MWEEFGRLLKHYRKDCGLTQEQLLEKLRDQGWEIWSKGTVSKWEHGLQRPNAEVTEILEDILGVRKGILFGAARYKIEMVPSQQTTADAIDLQFKKKEHSDLLGDIAHILLSGDLDTLTLRTLTGDLKDDPRWIEYYAHFKYSLIDRFDSISQITQQQLAFIMERNIETVLWRYGKKYLDSFLSHLEAEPDIASKDLYRLLEEKPFQLVKVLRLLAIEKMFKGTCPVCNDWQ